MGFNIGISSKQLNEYVECRYFIDRAFFNFVQSFEMYGNESIIIRSGNYYELDLLPLTKFVYTWDEPSELYINENLQKTTFLLNLVKAFRDKIKTDNSVCNKIEYVWLNKTYLLDKVGVENLKKVLGENVALEILKEQEPQLNEIKENPNPWEWYFKELQILTDLDNLIKSIQCYKDKGVDEIFLTAG
jgi:hypothetical protein